LSALKAVLKKKLIAGQPLRGAIAYRSSCRLKLSVQLMWPK
jgi:hypothetical protein